MKSLMISAVDYVREQQPAVSHRLLPHLPFLLLATATIFLSVVWGLRETRMMLVLSGVAGSWQDKLFGGFHFGISDTAFLTGRTLWALVRSFLLPALSVIAAMVALAIRLAGVVFPRIAPRASQAGWVTLGLGMAILCLDILF
jgi:hypothetical protein